jgi:hypothetical protein
MGEWSTITYLRSADLDHVAGTVTALCGAEGYLPTGVPSGPAVDAMRYGPAVNSPLWTVALVPGAGEWTMLMTAPIELLGERRPGTSRPRLADLAVLADRDAFTWNLYGGTACVLAEASRSGQVALSGFPFDDEWWYHDEPLDEEYAEPRFRLLDVSPELHAAASHDIEAFEVIGELLGGAGYPWQIWYNGVPDELIAGQDASVAGARTLRYARR